MRHTSRWAFSFGSGGRAPSTELSSLRVMTLSLALRVALGTSGDLRPLAPLPPAREAWGLPSLFKRCFELACLRLGGAIRPSLAAEQTRCIVGPLFVVAHLAGVDIGQHLAAREVSEEP